MNQINQKIALASTCAIFILIIGLYKLQDLVNPVLLLITITFLIYIIIFFISKTFYKPIEIINKQIITFNEKYKLGVKNNSYEKDLQHIINAIEQEIDTHIKNINNISQIKTKFVANASHELKTPIFSIKGFVETLLDGAVNDSKVNIEFLKKI